MPSSKIAFASKNEIAATYMTRSSIMISPPTHLPVILNKSPTNMIDSLSLKVEEQLFPPNLRLNDDILSVQFNNITSNIKKRHSLCDSNDSIMKYLTTNIESQQPIQVRDDSLRNSSSPETKPTIVAYENLLGLEKDDDDDDDEHQPETIIESFISDTESEGSLSSDIESIISFSTTTITNLKSLLKTPTTPKNTSRRVVFDPFALLLDAAVLGEVDLLIKSAKEVRLNVLKILFINFIFR
jgi:hypothetical protein